MQNNQDKQNMQNKNKKKETHRTGMEVAVIGMACRFPGARNYREYWKNLKEGKESVTFLSPEELESTGINPELLNDPNYVPSKGGVLEDKEYFDPFFFDYTPREAQLMDPQMRIFHEVCWEALEDSGYNPITYKGLIGLYAGSASSYYWETLARFSGQSNELGTFAAEQLTNKDYLTARISYKLNLKGPNSFVQTACSTSMVAIHQACRSLLTGDSKIYLAGGVAISPSNSQGYLFQEGMILSKDGHCRAFDAQATGTIPGNGAGVVVLKLLKNAESDKDHIHAIIRGTGSNNDGNRKVGFTAPSVEGQSEAIRRAFRMSKVEAETITYVETHGTATQLGDPVEIEALKRAFKAEKIQRKQYCALGSVKANFGHLDAAAGVASFIKTVLCLKHRQIPPSLHFETPNPKIKFQDSPFYVNTALLEWNPQNQTPTQILNHNSTSNQNSNQNQKNGHPRRAGISSFGIGGTNVHAILEEAPHPPTPTLHPSNLEGPTDSPHHLILLSAKTQTALQKMTENLNKHLQDNPHIPIEDVAFTLQNGRREFPHRKRILCTSIPELLQILSDPKPPGSKSKIFETKTEKTGDRPVIFVFPGLGSQYINMGKDLYQKEPLFKETMDQCIHLIKPIIKEDIKQILYPESNPIGDKIHQTQYTQPIIFIFEYTLATLLIKKGIEPHAMIGYSFGEYVAACISGVMTLEHALNIIVQRSRLIQTIPDGAMLSVPLTREETEPHLTGPLSIAIDNGYSTIISGPKAEVEVFEKKMASQKILCFKLDTTHALHNPIMQPILEPYQQAIREILLNPPTIPYISNLTGNWITIEEATTPTYWANHISQPVEFAKGIRELLKIQDAIFIEVGPGNDISSLLMRFIKENSSATHNTLNLVRHPKKQISDHHHLLIQLGNLWGSGKKIDWTQWTTETDPSTQRVSLPTYPFDHQFYWIDESIVNQYLNPKPRKPATPSYTKEEEKNEFIQNPEDIQLQVPYWRTTRTSTQHKKSHLQSSLMIFTPEDNPFCHQLIQELFTEVYPLIIVKKGDSFNYKKSTESKKSTKSTHSKQETPNQNMYTINPQNPQDYSCLFNQLKENSLIPQRILYCWSLPCKNQNTPLPSNPEHESASTFTPPLEEYHQFLEFINFTRKLAQNPVISIPKPISITIITEANGNKSLNSLIMGTIKELEKERKKEIERKRLNERINKGLSSKSSRDITCHLIQVDVGDSIAPGTPQQTQLLHHIKNDIFNSNGIREPIISYPYHHTSQRYDRMVQKTEILPIHKRITQPEQQKQKKTKNQEPSTCLIMGEGTLEPYILQYFLHSSREKPAHLLFLEQHPPKSAPPTKLQQVKEILNSIAQKTKNQKQEHTQEETEKEQEKETIKKIAEKYFDPTHHQDLLFQVSDPEIVNQIQQREQEIQQQLSIKGLHTYEGLQSTLETYCSSCILHHYILSNGITLQKGQEFESIEAFRNQFQILPKFYKFFDFFLQVFQEDLLLEITTNGQVRILKDSDTIHTPESIKKEALKPGNYPQFRGTFNSISYCSTHYPKAIKGETEAISILFPEGRYFRENPEYKDDLEYDNTRVYIQLLLSFIVETLIPQTHAHHNAKYQTTQAVNNTNTTNNHHKKYKNINKTKRPFRILEVGAGQGSIPRQLIPALLNLEHHINIDINTDIEYHFTDIGKFFVINAEKQARTQGIQFMKFGVFDISKDPETQGYEHHSFDLVLGLNVVHASPNLKQSIGNLKKCLTPNGILALIEGTHPPRWMHMIDGLAEGWWYFEDTDIRKQFPLLSPQEWENLMLQMDFEEPRVRVFPQTEESRITTKCCLVLAQKTLKENTPEYNAWKQALIHQKNEELTHLINTITHIQQTGSTVTLKQNPISPSHSTYTHSTPDISTLLEETENLQGPIKSVIYTNPLHLNIHMSQIMIDTQFLEAQFSQKSLEYLLLLLTTNASHTDQIPTNPTQMKLQLERAAIIEYLNLYAEDLHMHNHSNHPYPVISLNIPTTETQLLPEILSYLLQSNIPQATITIPESLTTQTPAASYPINGTPQAASQSPGEISQKEKTPQPQAPSLYKRPELSTEYTPPTNPTEEILVDIFQNYFGIQQIGIQDDFFELGMDSLIATVLVTRINQRMNIHIPLAELYQNTTHIKQLSEYIQTNFPQHHTTSSSALSPSSPTPDQSPYQGNQETKGENLVLLKKGTQPDSHLFIVHAGSGEVGAYLELCNLLDPTLNCWGIQADKTGSPAPRNLYIEEIAQQYTEKIKAVQPKGPYHISGWSAGAAIAFEIALILEQQNQEVSFLGIISSTAPQETWWYDAKEFTYQSELNWLNTMLKTSLPSQQPSSPPDSSTNPSPTQMSPSSNTTASYTTTLPPSGASIENLFQQNENPLPGQDHPENQNNSYNSNNQDQLHQLHQLWNQVIQYLESNHISIETLNQWVPQYMVNAIPSQTSTSPQLGIREWITYLNVIRTFMNAQAYYIPKSKINAPLFYIEASETEEQETNRKLWNNYTTHPIKEIIINGTHNTIFQSPQVQEFATALTKALQPPA